MARNDYETSEELAQPVSLYEIGHGDTAAMRYTDAEAEVTYDGEVYEPHPIDHSKIESTGKMESKPLTLTVPLDSPLAVLFSVYPPSRVVTITIREGDIERDDVPSEWAEGENFPASYVGRIIESRRSGNNAELTCEPISLKRPGLTRNYQWGCPLALFSTRCGANKAAATQPVEVLSVSGNAVTFAPDWNVAANSLDYYIGGLLEWDGDLGRERRTILRMDGDTAVLAGPVWDLEATDSADVILGCPHTLDGCQVVHDNAPNYGGQPWIPSSGNPIGKNNHF